MGWRCTALALGALLAVAAVAAQSDAEGEFVIFIDNHNGDYFRSEPSQTPVSPDGVSATLSALLGVPPVLLNDEGLHSQVDSLLVPNPFTRPDVVMSLEVFGAQDEFALDSDNHAACCGGCASHVRPLAAEPLGRGSVLGSFGEAVQSLAGAAAGASAGLVHADLACDALAATCDAACQEQLLEAFADAAGMGYARGAAPMAGTLSADQEVVELAHPELADLGTELACLARAAQRDWVATPEASEGVRPVQRHLLTGTLDSLTKVKAAHGKDSKTFKAASRLLAKGIGAAKKAVRDTFSGKMVGQVAVLDEARQVKVGGEATGARRRSLLADGDRDRKDWQSKALMGMVGFMLVVVTILCTICMFSMELKQDTILYGKSKAE